jgi:thioesterase domain-containing protein/aryl carrier-like protein
VTCSNLEVGENFKTVPYVSTSQKVELLTQIWQEVLQLESVDQHDNFFDLGGDSALAIQLFTRIASSCGQQLPPVMIYHVPTIASQAELLEQSTTPELSPLVLLKSGDLFPPVFIAPGLGGGPAEFFQLVEYVDTPHSIYGLQPKGIEGFDEPCARIEDMASFYLRGILRVQPRGRYILAGYSLGGLVALEMARMLRAAGNEIALLVMLDSYPDRDLLSLPQKLRLSAQRMKTRFRNRGRIPRSSIRMGGLADRDGINVFAPAFEHVRESAFAALRRYTPSFYPGPVKFVRAAELTDFPANPAAVWSGLMPKLEIDTVPGDHLGMLTREYAKLGAVFTRYLQQVTHSE